MDCVLLQRAVVSQNWYRSGYMVREIDLILMGIAGSLLFLSIMDVLWLFGVVGWCDCALESRIARQSV